MISLSQTLIDTPLGNLIAIASEKGLFILTFQEELSFISTRLERYYKEHIFNSQHSKTLDITRSWIENYFNSKNSLQSILPSFDLQGTIFAQKTLETLSQVAFATTQTYGELAKNSGFDKAQRAVGRVIGMNPIAIMIPCHRIIGANGALTGFRSGLKRKEWLLKYEFNKNAKKGEYTQ